MFLKNVSQLISSKVNISIPDVFFRTYAKVGIAAYDDAKLCFRFSSGKEAVRPMIFSHGLSGAKDMYTGIYHAMAANGYLVIAINH